MSTLRALPYVTADEALTVTASILDAPGAEARPDGSIDLFTNFSGTAQLDLQVSVDTTGLASTLPAGEDVDADLVLHVVARGNRARRRAVVLSTPPRSGHHTVTMSGDEWAGGVTLTAHVTRRQPFPRPDGAHAHRTSGIVAEQPVTTLWFDAPPTSTGNSIPIRWVDFTSDDRYPNGHLFAIRLEGESPAVLLNSSISHAQSILTSKGTHGVKARIRDATFAQIVMQGWSSILTHVFHELLRSDAEDEEQRLDGLLGWERQVLQDWAPFFNPSEADATAAVERLVKQLVDESAMVALEQLADVVQSRFAPQRAFEGLIRDAVAFTTGDG